MQVDAGVSRRLSDLACVPFLQRLAGQTHGQDQGKLSLFQSQACPGSRFLVFLVHTVLLHKLDTTDDSCPILPRTLTNRTYRFLCLLHTAQRQGCVSSPVLLVHCCRLH